MKHLSANICIDIKKVFSLANKFTSRNAGIKKNPKTPKKLQTKKEKVKQAVE